MLRRGPEGAEGHRLRRAGGPEREAGAARRAAACGAGPGPGPAGSEPRRGEVRGELEEVSVSRMWGGEERERGREGGQRAARTPLGKLRR